MSSFFLPISFFISTLKYMWFHRWSLWFRLFLLFPHMLLPRWHWPMPAQLEWILSSIWNVRIRVFSLPWIMQNADVRPIIVTAIFAPLGNVVWRSNVYSREQHWESQKWSQSPNKKKKLVKQCLASPRHFIGSLHESISYLSFLKKKLNYTFYYL
jgi:hypothetical protein